MARIVVALGGNALGKSPGEQLAAVKNTASSLVDLIEAGHEIIIAHGNGPQVGMINLAFTNREGVAEMPFPECGAMSQGYIGYHLQNALREELVKRECLVAVAAIVSQVIVNRDDPAFANPSKPVGSFYSKEEADRLSREKGYMMVEDAGRGYRRVVASPYPVEIVEKDIIKTLVEAGKLVIACGGGGIPVIRDGHTLKGVAAVIDKDLASAKLAQLLEADILLILTVVEKVAINFRQKNQQWLDRLTIAEAKKLNEAGHFIKGSMEPKVRAAIDFSSGKDGRKTIITSLGKAGEALAGKTGTKISK